MMKAAIVKEAGENPVLGHFKSPIAKKGQVLVNVSTAALSGLSKYRSMGKHYSSGSNFPIVAGADGIGTLQDGTRVYFAFPSAPYGSLAEQTVVDEHMLIHLPEGVDDVLAAAIVNPAMSAWAALVYRGGFSSGQTVLINGATGASGSLAVKIARHLGAKKIIATGRNEAKLRLLDADEIISFNMSKIDGAKVFEDELKRVVVDGVDVVLDYLWGDSALAIMVAIAKNVENKVTRFISIGTSSGQEELVIPSTILRSSSIELLGSGGRSVSGADMLASAKRVLELAAEGKLTVPTVEYKLENIAAAWAAPLTPRPVIRV